MQHKSKFLQQQEVQNVGHCKTINTTLKNIPVVLWKKYKWNFAE